MEEDQITQEDSYKDLTASYDPADDKLRLRSLHRLPKELYERLTKGIGFQWAPKQQLLYAIWSPNREDLLLSLAGEIGDEDTSLVERAEQRAERFGEYKESRTDDAERAYGRFKEISSGIPLGQPIILGHHSERRARRDAEKIENAVRQAVKMWDTAKYWQARAKGALLHAEYKERADVRYRRIKGLESDRRREEKGKQEAELALKLWNDPDKELTLQRAKGIANSPICSVSRSFPLKDFPRDPPASQYEGSMSLWSALEDGVITPEQAREFAVKAANYRIYSACRWLQHIENRLLYERAMLDEAGGDPGERFDFAVGGRVLTRGEWCVITRINKKDGRVLSLSTNRFTVQVEDVKEYQPPTPEEVETGSGSVSNQATLTSGGGL